jgi:hypothetical protein
MSFKPENIVKGNNLKVRKVSTTFPEREISILVVFSFRIYIHLSFVSGELRAEQIAGVSDTYTEHLLFTICK